MSLCLHIDPNASAGDIFPARCYAPTNHNTPYHYVIYEQYHVDVRWPNEDYREDL
jgi:hypothetical protein